MTVSDSDERRLAGLDFLLTRSAELTPNALAIDDLLSQRQLTFGELHERTLRLANGLQGLGICAGSRVAYALPNSHQAVETLFACALLGAVAVPLNTRLHPGEASRFLGKHKVTACITHEDLAALGSADSITTRLCVDGSADSPYERLIGANQATSPAHQTRWEDPFALGMTGGTTGGSKAVVWSHGGYMMDMLTVIAHLGLQRRDTTVCLAPTYHIAGLGWALLPVLWHGGTVIFPPSPSFDPDFVVRTLRERRVDYLFMVPAMVEPLYAAWDDAPFDQPRTLALASAPTHEPQRIKLARMFPGTELVTGYGMTETFSISFQASGDFLSHADGCGEATLGTRVKVVDGDNRELPRGREGRILARTLALGYYDHDPQATQTAFVTLADDPQGLEWMDTGDIGTMDDAGRLRITDRAKDVVITGGENVATSEVEAVVASHPDVLECAAFGLPDDRWGELLTIALVRRSEPQQGAPMDDRELVAGIIELCRGKLARYKVPKAAVFLDALPRSHFGKVLKRQLRQIPPNELVRLS